MLNEARHDPWNVEGSAAGADRYDSSDAQAMRAVEAFALQGRSVRIIRPMPGYSDFNDEIRGMSS